MPLFIVELNRLANQIGNADLTIWLHTAAPTDVQPNNGRTNKGGGAWETGAELTAANISDASNGDISNTVAIPFPEADEDVGTITHWSAYRGADPVGHGTVSSVVINSGDSYTIPIGALQFNGS